MKIKPGEAVIAVLHSPREKLLGILDDVSPAGVGLRSSTLGFWCQWRGAMGGGRTVSIHQ